MTRSQNVVQPSRPASLAWSLIRAEAEYKQNSRNPFCKVQNAPILHGVSGEVQGGQILALMGASGAGKTTLLNILNGCRTHGLDWKGQIKINGEPVKRQLLQKSSAYVKQFEDYYPFLTIREHLEFYAELKLGNQLNKRERKKMLDNLIEELLLDKCVSAFVGIPGVMKTLSGGEYKRLILATELLNDASIILCDEPTTGLDSRMAAEVVSVLRVIADRGKVVVCTIHQPSSSTFAMFDNLMLLSDGRVAYNGPRDGAIQFFNSVDLKIPDNMNPADFYIKSLAVIPGREHECQSRNTMICDKFELESPCRSTGGRTLMDLNYDDEEPEKKYAAQIGIPAQMRLLIWRSLLLKWRTETGVFGPVFIQFVFVIIFSVIFWQQPATDVGSSNQNNATFMIFLGFSFFFLQSEAFTMTANLPIICKEIRKHFYDSAVHIFSSFISQVLWSTLPLLVYLSIFYWSIGLPVSASTFLKLILLVMISMMTSLCFAVLYIALINNYYLITQFTNILLSLLIIPSGFWINVRTIPSYFTWLKDISWFTYTLESTFTTIWKDIHFLKCTQPSPDGGCIDTGFKVLQKLGFDYDRYWEDVMMIVVLGVAYMILGNILFFIRVKQFRE